MNTSGVHRAHRVRVMWERPAGVWGLWPLKKLRRRVPIYVFVGYKQGEDKPLRICLRGDRSAPFVIDDPLAYDGGYFKHGPYANDARYDRENEGAVLSDLFAMLQRWASHGGAVWQPGEQEQLDRALDAFYGWIWREHQRDLDVAPGFRREF